jgi:hypothetical protein
MNVLVDRAATGEIRGETSESLAASIPTATSYRPNTAGSVRVCASRRCSRVTAK